MSIRFRVECGDRIIELQARSRAEALKAFKYACDGVLDWGQPETQLVSKWMDSHPFGEQKISAIKAVRGVTGCSLREAKDFIERISSMRLSVAQIAELKRQGFEVS